MEVIKILVVCNNKDKKWCPYGEKNCRCDHHEPIELVDDDRDFSCTDINNKSRNCHLIDYEEYKIRVFLEDAGYKQKEINALLVLFENGLTPEEYELCYKGKYTV